MNYKPYRTQNCHIYLLIALFLLFSGVQTAYQAVNWPHINEIKSGDQKLLLQPIVSSPFDFPQGYSTNFSSIPIVLIAMRNLQISPTTQNIDFRLVIKSVSTSQFVTTVTAPNGLPLTLLYYMYIAIKQPYSHTYFYYYSQDLTTLLNNSQSLNTTVTKNINASITQYASARVIPFFISFKIGANSSEYSIDTSGSMTASSTLAIKILSNSSLSRVELMVVVVDAFSYTIGFINFLDYGFQQQFNNGSSKIASFSAPSIDYYNLISGVTAIRLPVQQAISFYLMPDNSYYSSTSYTYIKSQVLQWRLRQCINNSMLYYAPAEALCYDNCFSSPIFTYGENGTYNFCAICNETCLTCLGDGQSCKTCDPNNKRFLNNSSKTCDCSVGFYYILGFKLCATCDYTCKTCKNTSTNCLSCENGRTLTNSTCPCNSGTYDTLTNNVTCLVCDQRCATCRATSTNCTSCVSGTGRIFDSQNLKCPCGSGFLENGTSVCISTPLICTSPCLSCVGTSSNCTSCDTAKNRVVVNNQCQCNTGYTGSSVTDCIEICGDGKILTGTYQCDDGNTVSGDGCSNVCTIQSGFTCINSNATSPASTCTNSNGYSISSSYLLRDTSSNSMTATVSFSPFPPPAIVPTILDTKGQISLNSYSIDPTSGTMSITFNILQEITLSSLGLSFSIINQTTSLPLSVSNNLQLRPYSNFQLSVYNIQTYLTWAFIGMLWIGSIIFVAFVDVKSFNGVFELFMFVSLAWIGVEGQQTYALLFVPLKNLRYIYGMNFQLASQDSLFSVFNIGCINFFIPLLGFIAIMLINIRKSYVISTKIKRFILFDILYAWLIINGFLIVYGLSLTTKDSKLSALETVGIVFGIVYLLLCFFASFKLFSNNRQVQINPKMQISKKNMFRPQLYVFTVNLYLLFSLMYLSISKSLKINSIVMISIFFLMFLLYALGNILINKIRYMLNLVILIFVYACIMLYNNVSNAVWSGLAVTALLYIQLVINFTFFVFEKSKQTSTSSDKSETVKVDYELNQTKVGIDVQREPEFDQLEHSQNKSALQGQYQNHFTVYEPTIKKPLQIMINPPEMFLQTNAIDTAMKTFTGRSEKNRLLLDKRQNYYASTKQEKVQQDEIIDMGEKEVDMDAI